VVAISGGAHDVMHQQGAHAMASGPMPQTPLVAPCFSLMRQGPGTELTAHALQTEFAADFFLGIPAEKTLESPSSECV
jgi:hypothetical protein